MKLAIVIGVIGLLVLFSSCSPKTHYGYRDWHYYSEYARRSTQP